MVHIQGIVSRFYRVLYVCKPFGLVGLQIFVFLNFEENTLIRVLIFELVKETTEFVVSDLLSDYYWVQHSYLYADTYNISLTECYYVKTGPFKIQNFFPDFKYLNAKHFWFFNRIWFSNCIQFSNGVPFRRKWQPFKKFAILIFSAFQYLVLKPPLCLVFRLYLYLSQN